MQKRYLVFDFDGTIANTVDPAMELANDILKEMGEETLTKEQLASLRDKSYLEIIKAFDVAIWKVPGLLLKLRTTLQDHFEMVKPYPHIIDVLKKLSKEGHYMYVLTSNDKAFVQRFLDAFDINCFEDIYSEMNIFGKAEALKKFMKLQGISAPDMLYVGDEVRDIDACRKNKVTIVSVSWGFNTEDKLKEHSPDEIVKSPDDLHAAIKKLSE
jgi:phosphoglycolate phosphatase-like HAD superfamily hydrolase